MKKIVLSIAFIFAFSFSIFSQTYNDATLRRVIEQDKTSRDSAGKLLTLAVTEHLYRADVYMSNRQFPEAREHFQKILDNYPTDAEAMPKVLFGTARSYMWERQYEKAVFWFDKLTKDFLGTKEGREGLAFKGASYVRMQKHAEAAKTYEQYITMFPTGEKIESAFLNLIDSLREAARYEEANSWVDKVQQRFAGMPVATNALQARLRMEIYRQSWTNAIITADRLRMTNVFKGSMTSADEVTYLKAFALEKLNRKSEAVAVYSSIPDNLNSYYSSLATDRLKVLSPQFVRKTASVSPNLTKDYPVLYRNELLRYAKSRNVDPRFALAIMKQESSFRANAKSPAAARGLLQLVFDTALKYNKKAGFPNLQADDLYNPATNIAIGSLYMSDLKNQFNGMYEAVAASYNGGEDNVARWLKRSNPKDAAIFASEVGFAETKNYVFKVMNNYRIYRELYTEDLIRK
jgi:soluble lytic murein transglycosylase